MNHIADTLLRLGMRQPEACRNLTMLPLTGQGLAQADYLTLDSAISSGVLSVAEIDRGGSVPELQVVNKGQMAVLMLDGEELVGAMQNRILNVTVLVPAGAKVTIPVSCVEAGRWRAQSSEFHTSRNVQFAEGRAEKSAQILFSMRERGRHESDQGEVWRSISHKARRMNTRSGTQAMSDIFEQHTTSIGEFVTALPPQRGQLGAVFAIDGRICGAEVFDCESTLRALLPKLISSYALDAIDRLHTHAAPAAEPLDTSALSAFVTAVAEAEVLVTQSPGEGEDLRLAGTSVVGGALRARGRVVHLNAFSMGRQEEATAAHSGARMQRASQRGRKHQ